MENTEEIKPNGQAGKVEIIKPKRVSKLKAKDPVLAEPSKPKILIYGKAGVGKTWASLEFPKVYYIDTEGGANLSHYTDRLTKAGGVYLGIEDGALDPKTVLEQVQALATEQHEYRTIVIDSVSNIFNKMTADEQDRLGDKDGFGASKKPAVAWARKLLLWLARIDMNVILICHEKDKWEAGQSIGTTFDFYEKTDYLLDLCLNIQKRGKSRVAVIKKSRLLGFPEGESIDWTFSDFASRYGQNIIQRDVKPITLATADQLAKIKLLLEVVKIEETAIQKLFTNAKVEDWSEMSSESIEKAITFFQSKLTGETK
jgi:hypothetical protein